MKDIIARNGIVKTQELDDLIDVLASCIGSLTNPSRIEATFKSELHSDISRNTIYTYIEYLKDSFLIEESGRFDVKGRRHIGSPRKYYFEDIGLRNARLGFRQVEETHIMENIVYNELCLRGYVVDVGVVEKRVRDGKGRQVRKQLECDFVANKGSERLYVQSAFQIPTRAKEEAEKASLLESEALSPRQHEVLWRWRKLALARVRGLWSVGACGGRELPQVEPRPYAALKL